jgi:hypothetical protein
MDDLENVKRDGLYLKYVKNQDKKICLAAVNQNGWALQYVKDQDKDICLAAVNQYGLALEFVKDQDKEICLAAVNQNGYALQYVKNQDKDICLAAFKKNEYSLMYVNNKLVPIIQEYIINNKIKLKDPNLSFIIDKDRNKLLDLITRKTKNEYDSYYSWGIKYVKQNKELCLKAIVLNKYFLNCVNTNDKKLVLHVYKKYPNILKYINKQNIEILKCISQKYILPKIKN